jgi:adenine/guanine phosphoribosyltransferase-like PRPP-binding protein
VSDTIPTSPNKRIDVVIGLDARGFLLGPVIALRLGAAFVPVRKRGKLPGECVRATYEKEYGAVRHVYTHPFFCSFRLRHLVVVVLNATEHPCPHPSQSWARRVVWCGVVWWLISFLGGCVDHHSGQDEFEMQADAIAPGQTVVIVDDILATGAPCLS